MNTVPEPGPAVPFTVCLGLLCQVHIIAPVTCFSRTRAAKPRRAEPPDWTGSCRGSQRDVASTHLPLSDVEHNAGLQSCRLQGRSPRRGCHPSPEWVQMVSRHHQSHHPFSWGWCFNKDGAIQAQRLFAIIFTLNESRMYIISERSNVTVSLQTRSLTPAWKPQMSGLRCPGIQPIMNPREQPQGWLCSSWPMGLPSLDGAIRRAPQPPGQPDKGAQCGSCDTGHSSQVRHSPEMLAVAPDLTSFSQPLSLSPTEGGVLSPGASLSLSVWFFPPTTHPPSPPISKKP